MVNETIGHIIKAKRKELNLTQSQLAELINSDEYYISAIETGRRKPGRKFLVALSNALNIPVDVLLGIESNIVLHETVSELEKKLQKLSNEDKELVLGIIDKLVDRFSAQ